MVPKKGGKTVVRNEKNELLLTRTFTGWRVYIDYRKLNKATRKDHFPLPFIDRCWTDWLDMSITISWMVTQGIIRFPLH